MNREQMAQFSDFIGDTYGSPEGLAKQLELAIEMLFYLEVDTFDRKDIQGVVSALRGTIDVLRHSK